MFGIARAPFESRRLSPTGRSRLLPTGHDGKRTIAGRSFYHGLASVASVLILTTPLSAPSVHSPSQGVTAPASSAEATVEPSMIAPAEDPVTLLERGLAWHDANVRDYQGVFAYREQKDGQLGEPVACRFRFRLEPFSLYMEWIYGAGRVDKLLYVEGQNDGKMIVHPTGLIGLVVPSAAVHPDGKEARKSSSHSITEFGLRTVLAKVLRSFREAAEEDSSTYRRLGLRRLDNREVLTLTKTEGSGTLTVDLDPQTLLPVRTVKHDADGQLFSIYEFKELRFNQGVDESAFARESCGL